ncbi:hypothetical protein [Curtobacterium sp. PhB136]|uniref:hypothetical protein n=1 Tax=Curtobacterium sp. PhB136 TaxID=2485181 RepID=UPI0014043150|nr:hypothetical protein [Curtobacterium sp. PhB136]
MSGASSVYGALAVAALAGIVVGLGGATVLTGFRRAVRRSVRPDHDVNPPPRGVR